MRLKHSTRTKSRAFTGWDLLICVVTVVLLLGFLLPAMTKQRGSSNRINCVSNLKQIGLAFRMWSNDKGDKFPMHNTNGGTMEFCLTGEVWRHFSIISNELNTPKMLVCATDTARQRVSNFAQFTNNSHLSYFVGLDAEETMPQTILTGDRNIISPTVKPVKGVLSISTNNRVEWTKAMHNQAGNVGLADGSASQATSAQLNKQFQAAAISTTQAVYRIALPE